jgi:biopolymer transport protein ExbB
MIAASRFRIFALASMTCWLLLAPPAGAQGSGPVAAAAQSTAASEPTTPPNFTGPTAQRPVTASAPPAGGGLGSLLPRDLSPWSMFLAANAVVKAVILGLIAASIITWTIWLAKSLELAAARRRLRRALLALDGVRSLAEATERDGGQMGPVGPMMKAAQRELQLSDDAWRPDGLKERVASRLERIEAAAGRAMTRGTGVLATIGSTAPFVGLFGTVWGIMNSFVGIAKAHTTNLAVVAPGIAEALLATAIGLVAAIPAVVIYNVFARSIAGYRVLVADASAEVMRLVSRDLDRQSATRPPRHLQAAE